MSLFYQPRHHYRTLGGHHNHPLAVWGREPTTFDLSPFNQPFHAPFLSLFNDTFSQLDRLSNDLNGQVSESGGWQGLLTRTPKFDVKETEEAYVLEGELPGVEKDNVSLQFADDHTLVLKTKTESFKETKPQASSGQGDGSNEVEMSGANAEAGEGANKDTTVATTNKNTDVAKSAAPQPTYHLTERTHSSFQRVFSFPDDIKHEEVKASLKNGVLSVTVPKVVKGPEPEKKSRSVTIEDVSDDVAAEGENESDKAKL